MSEPPASASRAAPLALWRIAQAFLHTLYNLFGAPKDVARAHTLTKRPYQMLMRWLRVGETLLRRLLLIEAALLPALSPTPPRASRARPRRLIGFDAEHPEAWRVSFRCFAPAPLRQAQPDANTSTSVSLSVSKAAVQKRFFSAWPLAERYEALIRVFNEPAAFARRLARRLRALPRLIKALLWLPPEASELIAPDDFAALSDAAMSARACFDSS